MDLAVIIAFSILTLAFSLLYFFIYYRNQERFMVYWGFSWISFTLSLISLMFWIRTGNELFLQIRKVTDMMNLLLLLFGTYHFAHRRIPSYWFRFSLYMLLLAVIFMVYGFLLLSFYLPISVFQTIITIFICFNIYHTRVPAMGNRSVGPSCGRAVYDHTQQSVPDRSTFICRIEFLHPGRVHPLCENTVFPDRKYVPDHSGTFPRCCLLLPAKARTSLFICLPLDPGTDRLHTG